MKKIKYLAMLFFAASMTLSFSACGDDDDDPIWDSNNPETPQSFQGSISDLKDTGSELSWTYTYTAQIGSQTITESDTEIYGYRGETITSHRSIITLPSKELAQAAFASYEKDDDYTVSLDGSSINIVYNPEEYADLTTVIVKQVYEYTKQELNKKQ